MDNSRLRVQRTEFLEGRVFYDDSIPEALKALIKANFRALFMPEIADGRIAAEQDSEFWKKWLLAQSIRATGTTSAGSKVVVYAHVPNYFSDPRNIVAGLKKGHVDGALPLPQDKFQELVDLNGLTDNQGNRLVWVVDYDTLKKSPSGLVPIGKALEHPQTIPFLGGRGRASNYLDKFKQVFGKDGRQIGIWHLDNLRKEPLARLLYVGNDACNGLNGVIRFLDYGQFVGVSDVRAPKISRPTLEQVLKVAKELVAPRLQPELKERIDALYKR